MSKKAVIFTPTSSRENLKSQLELLVVIRQYAPMKRRSPTSLHGVRAQIDVLILTAVRI
jgi:hypothetical protein